MRGHPSEPSQAARPPPHQSAAEGHPVSGYPLHNHQSSPVYVYNPRVAAVVDKSRVPQPSLSLHQSLQLLQVQLPPEPKSYVAWSVLNIIFFCFPLGFVALSYSTGVRSDYAAGRYSEAKSKSSRARGLNAVATVIGVVAIVVLGTIFGIQYNHLKNAG